LEVVRLVDILSQYCS